MNKVCTIYVNDGEPPFQIAIVSDGEGLKDKGVFDEDRKKYLKEKCGLTVSECFITHVIMWPPKDDNNNAVLEELKQCSP